MKEFLKNAVKLAIVALFVIALDIIIPFNSATGLAYVKTHGKLLMVVVALMNVFVGGALSAGFLSKDIRVGFTYWFMPVVIKGKVNPTYAFGAIAFFFNLGVVIWGVQP
jgi:hypothetical protein